MNLSPAPNRAVDPITVLEAALLCAPAPMPLAAMQGLFEQEVDALQLQAWLEQLQIDWAHRGLELVEVASGWRFQSRANVLPFIARLEPDATPRYSRAALEILAVIAYRQPVTRGDIEDVRGVAVNSQIIKSLEDRGWVEVIGHRESVGRPALFATTPQFLNDLGLASLRDLPEIEAISEATLKQLGLDATADATAQPSQPDADGDALAVGGEVVEDSVLAEDAGTPQPPEAESQEAGDVAAVDGLSLDDGLPEPEPEPEPEPDEFAAPSMADDAVVPNEVPTSTQPRDDLA